MLKDFDKVGRSLGFPMPDLAIRDLDALYDLNLGTFGIRSAPFYSLLLRKKELNSIK